MKPHMTVYPQVIVTICSSCTFFEIGPYNQLKICDFLSIVNNRFGRIWQRFQVTALGNMHDLDLTSVDHSRSKQMPPNERPYMTSYPSLVIGLAVSARVSKLRPPEICLTSIWPNSGYHE